MNRPDAIVLVSGGLDSSVVLALALERGLSCRALSFEYGQRHQIELTAAKRVCAHYDVDHTLIHLDIPRLPSALTRGKAMPKSAEASSEVPSTHVPGRNTLFLAHAFALAEGLGVGEIHFGPNADDKACYPDCRPAFVGAFQALMTCAAPQKPPSLVTPLLHLNKGQIVEEALRLGVPLELTWTCYDPQEGNSSCGECLACAQRREGFRLAHASDPALVLPLIAP